MTLGLAELDVPEGPGLDAGARRRTARPRRRWPICASTVRGIHPRVLADHGLAAAVREVADRSPVPVTCRHPRSTRLPAPVEAAAYFVVSEALANVAKHAEARQAQVHGWHADGSLRPDRRDDGVGGADRPSGTGLTGLVTAARRAGRHARRHQPARRADRAADGVPVPMR